MTPRSYNLNDWGSENVINYDVEKMHKDQLWGDI